jgi:AAA15 family ATPase/GTPase
MIGKLSIKNFKSIKDLEIDCKKINLFIGEPNTGKSNILEALGLLSWCGYPQGGNLRGYVRFQDMQDLFYDGLLDQPVEIEIDRLKVEIKFKDEKFNLESIPLKEVDGIGEKETIASMDYSGGSESWGNTNLTSLKEAGFIKFYRFKKQDKFPDRRSSFLTPLHGSNMFAVVMANKKLRKTMSGFFKSSGLDLVLKPREKTFEVQKRTEDLVINHPYVVTSDTLQRIIFHVIAMESNKDSTLVFEEPESRAFPYYTKYLGEKIAFDKTNQYFIATHNPYLLHSILEKARKDSVNVFITYFRDYQTKVKCLTEKQISELMSYDPFLNLDSFIE